MIPSLLTRIIAFMERKDKQIIALVIALYILAGVIYSFYLGNNFRFLPDESDYYTLASNLAFKGEYSLEGTHLTAYRPPGYPFFLAPFRLLGFDVVGLRILNYFILGLCIFVVYKMLLEHFSPLAGLLGAFLVMAYPVVFYTAGTLYPQTLASFLLIYVIYLYTHAPGRILETMTIGLLAGWLILTVPTFIFLLVVFAAWSWIFQRYQTTFHILFIPVIACLVVGIWSLRNYAVFNTFVFISTNSGENLLLGNSQNTTPNGGRTIDFSYYEHQAAGFGEVQRDQYFRNQAIEYILAHKFSSLRMYFLKFLNFFNYHNDLVTNSQGSTIGDILMFVTYYPLLLIVLFRLVFAKFYKLSSFEILWGTIYLTGAMVSAVFFTRIRFRIPFDYLLIMLVAVFIDNLIARWGVRSRTIMSVS